MSIKFLNPFVVAVIVLLSATATRAQSAFSNAVINLNPVAYWPLQETVQPPLAQIETNYGSFGAAGNAYYSSTNAVPNATGVTGDGDTAINFKGSVAGAFLAVPMTNGVSLPVGPFTVEAWVYPTYFGSGTNNTIISQTGPFGTAGLNGGTNAGGWSLNQDYIPSQNNNNSLLGWSFHVYNGMSSNGGAEVIAPYYILNNTWYHIVGVFDGVNTYLYVNGTNVGTQLSPINGTYVQDKWTPLTIGCGRGLNNNQYYGTIDEVALYTTALSAGRVLAHFNAVGNSSGSSSYYNTVLADSPYMYWRMDAPGYAAPPTTAYPVAFSYGTVANENGLYLSGDTPGVPGPSYPGLPSPSYACAFNGIGTSATNYIPLWTNGVSAPPNVAGSGIIITNLNPAFNVNNALLTNSVTAMCWFKSNPADDRYQGLFGHGDSSWKLSLAGTSGEIAWFPGIGGDYDTPAGINYNDGNWHFVVAVYQYVAPALGTNYIYVDGNLLAEEALTTAIGVASYTNVLLGGAPDYTPSGGTGYRNRFFSGSLAHCAYFTNALTAAQIVNLYTNATGGAPLSPPVILGQPVTGRTSGSGGTNGVGIGSYVSFSVGAGGGPPLSYLWYYNNSSNYNGTAIVSDGVKYTNTTTLNMTVSNLMATDSGYYYVIITNNYGSATSILATLQISLLPVIAVQSPPAGFSLYPNQSESLSLTVNGATPFSYQWYTNGVADTTAGTTASYTAGGQQAVNQGTYQCIVANAYGSATSAVQTVTLLSLPASIRNSSYATNVLAMGATGYWPMHETETQPFSGDIETNYGTWGTIGNGYYQDWAEQTVIHNSPGAIAGNPDGAVTFFNAEDAVVVPHWNQQLTLGTTNNPAFTLEAWVKPFVPGLGVANGTYLSIISEGAGTTNDVPGTGGNASGFVLQYGGTAETFSLVVFNGVGSADYEQKTVANYPPGQWYHIVCEWSGSNVVYYINGQQASELTANGTDNPQALNPETVAPIAIGGGRWTTSGGSGHPWEGQMDEVAVYTNLLTQQQIQNDYAAGTTTGSNYFQTIQNNGPALYYHMDAPNYTQPAFSAMPGLTNYGSVPINGVYVPSAVPGSAMGPSAAGFSSTNAMAGNGVMSFADAGISPLWNPTNTESFSYSAWVRGRPCDVRSYNEMFCANDGNWRSGIYSSGQFRVHGNTDIIPTNLVNDGNWHQWVMTANGYSSNNVVAFTNNVYIDGLLAVTQWATGSNAPQNDPGPEVTIGSEWGETNPVTTGGSRQFDGDICEAAFFYGTVLTPAQVQTLYNSGEMKPAITGQPVSGTAIVTLAFTNSVAALGAQPLYYQWYTNGVAIGGSAANFNGQITNNVNLDSLIINPAQFADVGSYYVIVTNAYGSATSSVVNLTVVGAPIITNQFPVTYTNQYTVYAGANPTFTIGVLGAPPAYYWSSNGVPIPGASKPSFTYTNVQVSFTNISCIVSNFLGTATGIVWSAQVIADPTNSNGGLAPYPHSVLALNPIAYWRLNDTNLDGPDNNNGDSGYICNDYVNGNNGIYTNVYLGQPGYNPISDPSDTSAQFGEDANNGPDFGDQDINSIAGINFATPTGSNAAFTVEAWVSGYPGSSSSDGGIVTLGWGNGGEQFNMDVYDDVFRFFFRDASDTAHVITTSVSPSMINDVLGPWYHLVATVDEVHSNNVVFYVNGAPVGTLALTSGLGVLSTTNLMDIGARMSSATSLLNDQYAGNINDVAIFNYALTPAQVAGEYFGIGIPPAFTQLPTSSITVSNGVLSIPVTATGTGPVGYYWYDQNGGTNVSTGVTNGNILNATLTIGNVPSAWNNDTLMLTVTNAYGSTNVSVALTVTTGLNVGLGPPSATFYAGRIFTYTAVSSGSAPFYYQWFTNSVAVYSATNASYTVVVPLGSLNIGCTVSNNFNGYSVTNAGPVTLTGIATPTNFYTLTVLSNNPIGFWPLNEPDDKLDDGNPGAIAHDYIGGNNGIYTNVLLGWLGYNTNADPSDTSALFGNFATPNSDVNAIPGPDFSTPNGVNAEFSVEAWVKSTGNNGLNTPTVAAKGIYDEEEYALDAGASDSYRFEVRSAAGTGYNANSMVSLSSTNQWYHLVGVCDETNGLVSLYIDGELIASTAIPTASGITNSSAIPMSIGARSSHNPGYVPGSLDQQFPGYISDVAIYSYALSPSQIAADYQAGIYNGGGAISFINPPQITFSTVNNKLVLNWPANYVGYYYLQVQTNALSIGISTNWVPYGGSVAATLNAEGITNSLSTTNGCVFYRLMTNAP